MNKQERSESYRVMITGLTTVVGLKGNVTIKGVATKTTEAVSTLQAGIDAPGKTATAEAAFHKAVADEKVAVADAHAMYQGVKDYALVQYANQPTVLAALGISAPQKRKPSVATKAAAADKQRATRAKLGTKGKRQKAAAKAAPAAAPAGSSNGTNGKSS